MKTSDEKLSLLLTARRSEIEACKRLNKVSTQRANKNWLQLAELLIGRKLTSDEKRIVEDD